MKKKNALKLLTLSMTGMTLLTLEPRMSLAATTSFKINAVKRIDYGISRGVETLTITPESSTDGTVVISNESTTAASSRLLAICYKTAQQAQSLSKAFGTSHTGMTAATTHGITYSSASDGPHTISTYTLKTDFPSSADLNCFVDEASAPEIR